MDERIRKENASIFKPTAVNEYNYTKGGIDLSDQMSSYNSSLRKGFKWYRKLMIELILGTLVVNSYILYKQTTHKKDTITEFKESIIASILDLNTTKTSIKTNNIKINHKLSEKSEKKGKRIIKKRCTVCYKNNS